MTQARLIHDFRGGTLPTAVTVTVTEALSLSARLARSRASVTSRRAAASHGDGRYLLGLSYGPGHDCQ
jgi:hypothetical protein